MVRVTTQILIGLMLLFGAVNLARRAVLNFKSASVARGLYFLLLFSGTLFLAVLAFYYAYSGIVEMLNKT